MSKQEFEEYYTNNNFIESGYLICRGCGKKVNGGEYIIGVFYCPMCASVIHKNNNDRNDSARVYKLPEPYEPEPDKLDYFKINNYQSFGVFISKGSACDSCSNNPKNGGSGICHCTLGLKTFY